MLQAHLCRVFHLIGTAAEELACGGRCHGAGDSYFSLAADFRAGNGGILFDDVAHKAGRGQGVDDLGVAERMSMGQVVKNTGHYAAGAAGGGGDDGAAGCVLLAYGKGVGEHQAARTEVGLVPERFHVIDRGFPGKVQRAGKPAVRIQAPFHGGFHRFPHFHQVVPDSGPFTQVHVFPEMAAVAVAPLDNLREGVHVDRPSIPPAPIPRRQKP